MKLIIHGYEHEIRSRIHSAEQHGKSFDLFRLDNVINHNIRNENIVWIFVSKNRTKRNVQNGNEWEQRNCIFRLSAKKRIKMPVHFVFNFESSFWFIFIFVQNKKLRKTSGTGKKKDKKKYLSLYLFRNIGVLAYDWNIPCKRQKSWSIRMNWSTGFVTDSTIFVRSIDKHVKVIDSHSIVESYYIFIWNLSARCNRLVLRMCRF